MGTLALAKARCARKAFDWPRSIDAVSMPIARIFRAVVNEAAEFATNDSEPDAAELWTDVYAQ